MTTFRCPSDILITSWLFTARWSTWPGNHLVPCTAELVRSCNASRFMHIGVFLIQNASFIHLICRCASLSTTLPCPSRWHGSLPRHGLWWLTCDLHCSPLLWRLGSMYQLWKSPLVSCVPWSSDQTSCLSLQHMSWSSSCKAHDRSIWSFTQGLFCLHYWNPRDFVNNMYSQCRCREHIRRVYTMGHSTFVSLWFSWKQIFRTS